MSDISGYGSSQSKTMMGLAVHLLQRGFEPSVAEFGQLLKDRVHYWRQIQLDNIAKKAKGKMERLDLKDPCVHPKIFAQIIEHSSWCDTETLQDMWAGLLATSCDEPTDKNSIYVDILSKMSHNEAKLCNHFCANGSWVVSEAENLVDAVPLYPAASDLKQLCGASDFEDVDQALVHLQLLGLIKREAYPSDDGYRPSPRILRDYTSEDASDNKWADAIEITPTSLALRLFLKTQGETMRPSEYVRLYGKQPE